MFSTDCATNASHLDITECRWGILWPRAQDGYSDAVTQDHTPPLSSHGSCKPTDEYPYYRGPCNWEDGVGVPAAMVSPLQWCPRCNGVPAAMVSPLQWCPRCNGVPAAMVSPLQWCPCCNGVPTATGPPVLFHTFCWLAPTKWWPHNQLILHGSDNKSTSTSVYRCICVL